MSENTHVIRLNHAAMDETPEGRIIFRGVIDPDSLMDLLVDDYQREAQKPSTLIKLINDMRKGETPPEIELGSRGGTYKEVEPGTIDLYDPTYIVDGQQRVTAGRYMLSQGEDPKLVHLGTTVYMNTDNHWERERFKKVNVERTRVSSNVLVHNLIPEFPVIELLHSMTTGRGDFVLQGRVQWGQNMKERELISSLTLLKVLASLMYHKGASKGSKYEPLTIGLQRVYDDIGPGIFRDNVKYFFQDIVDACWGIRTIAKKDPVPFIKLTFLEQLANMLSNHFDFWDVRSRNQNRLFVTVPDLRKLHSFPVYDPTVRNYASGQGLGRSALYQLMVEHMNKSRRTGQLKARVVKLPDPDDDDEDEEEFDESKREQTIRDAGLDPQVLASVTPQPVAAG